MKSLRVFFAIRLPKPVLALVKEIQAMLQHSLSAYRLHWTPVENLHITLQFLQAIQSTDLIKLYIQIQSVLKATPAFDLQLGQLEFFPSPKHPVVLALQAGPNEILANLAQLISSEMAALNYPPAQEQFRGHLTLGRLPHRRQQNYLLEPVKLPLIPAVKINEVVLFESEASKNQQSYTVLKYFQLS